MDHEIYMLREASAVDAKKSTNLERRPIATRNNRLVQRFTGWQVRKGVSTNFISVCAGCVDTSIRRLSRIAATLRERSCT